VDDSDPTTKPDIALLESHQRELVDDSDPTYQTPTSNCLNSHQQELLVFRLFAKL
jgi:hypothetical protein